MRQRSPAWMNLCALTCALVLGHCTARGPEAPPDPAAETGQATHAAPAPQQGSPALVSAHEPVGSPGAAAPAAPGPAISDKPSPHGELNWDTPPGWSQETPTSPMRMAQYRMPAAKGDGEDGECVVFYFGPGQGGDTASNVARWTSQFTTPQGGPAQSKVTEQRVRDRLVTRIEISGTYQPGSMSFGGQAPPPRPGYRLLGAIVPGGDANWFFRCTGPEKTMQANQDGFDHLLASIQ